MSVMANIEHARDGVRLGAGVFSARLTAKLAGVSLRRVHYWVAKDLIKPSAYRAPRGGQHLFEYRDVVQVRVVARLRQNKASLQKIRRAVGWLRNELAHGDWHEKTLVTDGTDVFALFAGDEAYSAARQRGQRVFTISLGEVVAEIEGRGKVLGIGNRIAIRPDVRGGDPVIKNTRLPTKLLRTLVREGMTPREIQGMYPGITRADVRAADQFERELEAV